MLRCQICGEILKDGVEKCSVCGSKDLVFKTEEELEKERSERNL